MPHWVALVAIVAVAWIVLAVVGGWIIGRGLGVIERHGEQPLPHGDADAIDEELRRAA